MVDPLFRHYLYVLSRRDSHLVVQVFIYVDLDDRIMLSGGEPPCIGTIFDRILGTVTDFVVQELIYLCLIEQLLGFRGRPLFIGTFLGGLKNGF